jgi:hypothetical protein
VAGEARAASPVTSRAVATPRLGRGVYWHHEVRMKLTAMHCTDHEKSGDRMGLRAAGLAIAALSIFLQSLAMKGEDARFRRFLVPVSVTNVRGAYGVVWSTELWYRNLGTKTVPIFPLVTQDWSPRNGQTTYLPIGSFPPSPGTFIWVGRDGSENAEFDLRLFGGETVDPPIGTRIPVVPEEGFRSRLALLRVPVMGDRRTMLRIYGLALSSEGERARVRLYDANEQLVGELDLPLVGAPAYAQVALDQMFPDLDTAVTIEVTAADEAQRIWAFATVVTNDTQRVTVLAPQ